MLHIRNYHNHLVGLGADGASVNPSKEVGVQALKKWKCIVWYMFGAWLVEQN